MRNRTTTTNDDIFDELGILRDGKTARITMRMRDAALASPTGAGSRGPIGQRENDLCTINGQGGRLQWIKGSLECVPTKAKDSMPMVTDASGTALGLHRPGFRVAVAQDQRAVFEDGLARRRYQDRMANSYKLRREGQSLCLCDGTGLGDDGLTCETCGGDGITDAKHTPSDTRTTTTVDRSVKDERAQAYLDYETELQSAWRNAR